MYTLLHCRKPSAGGKCCPQDPSEHSRPMLTTDVEMNAGRRRRRCRRWRRARWRWRRACWRWRRCTAPWRCQLIARQHHDIITHVLKRQDEVAGAPGGGDAAMGGGWATGGGRATGGGGVATGGGGEPAGGGDAAATTARGNDPEPPGAKGLCFWIVARRQLAQARWGFAKGTLTYRRHCCARWG